MSYAIRDLHLEALAFTLNRNTNSFAPLWAGVCSCTEYTSQRRPLISEVLRDMQDHHRMHRTLEHERQLELVYVQRETARKARAA